MGRDVRRGLGQPGRRRHLLRSLRALVPAGGADDPAVDAACRRQAGIQGGLRPAPLRPRPRPARNRRELGRQRRRRLHRAAPRGNRREEAIQDAHLRPDQAPRREGGRARRIPRRHSAGQSRGTQPARLAQVPEGAAPQPEEARMNEIKLPQGPIRYRESGDGPPLVFVHGLLVDGRLWRKVTPLLEDRYRCIVPDIPLGSHQVAMNPDADLSPTGLAQIVSGFLEALGLDQATVVANDTGGAISQITAARHPERIGRLLLTNCDAFENFLPPAFRPLQWAAHVPGMLTGVMQGMRFAPMRRLPNAYGRLIKRDLAGAPTREWIEPYLSDRAVRRDTVKVLKGIDPKYTIEAAEELSRQQRPTLLAWAREDRFFKPKFAERLAAKIPGARLEWIDDSYTFVSEDQPERLAELIGTFAGPLSSPAAPASG